MKFTTLVLAGVLAIFTMSLAIAKTYDVAFGSRTKVGSVELKPGDYRISLSGNKVTFTAVDTQKSFTTDVKVENGDKKFDDTRVDATNEGGTSVVKDIELGGTKVKIEF